MTTSHRFHRQRIVEIALLELGAGRVAEYWRDTLGPNWRGPYPKHWCGAFHLWCQHQAGVALDVLWIAGKGFCEVQGLPKTKQPEPGDVAYIAEPYQHHAVFVDMIDGVVQTIDGNQGGAKPVKVVKRKRSEITCFYSIAPFLSKLELETPRVEPEPVHRVPSSAQLTFIYPTLRLGDQGEGVKELQRRLRQEGYPLTVDGDFGPRTRLQVIEFQCANGLSIDGVTGPKTWALLSAVAP